MTTAKLLTFLLLVFLSIAAANCGRSGPHDPSRTVVSPDGAEKDPVAIEGPDIAPLAGTTARVVRVIDGDTIRVLLPDGTEETVRYIGINTPEMDQPHGQEAKEANASLVEGKQVLLVRDVSERDHYGRLLRYVYVDGIFVNAELVRRGYAQVATYPPDVARAEELLELQRQAQEGGAGLWAPARQETQGIPWDKAASHAGETATVIGPVVGTKYASSAKGKPTFLNLGVDYPDPRRFTVVIWERYRSNFPFAPEAYYRGKTIAVTGVIELYRGVPEIEVTSPSQIEVR